MTICAISLSAGFALLVFSKPRMFKRFAETDKLTADLRIR